MKVKFVAIYALAGVAFLAVSLWAFLSNGRSAKAIRYKYKLGGIMLTAWAMLSAASCEGPGPLVTCYEPVATCYDVAMPQDEMSVEVKGYGGNRLKGGDVLSIRISNPGYIKYRFLITAGGDSAQVLAEEVFNVRIGGTAYEMTLPSTEYKGAATLSAFGLDNTEHGTKEASIGTFALEII